jgi:hypothetical protein
MKEKVNKNQLNQKEEHRTTFKSDKSKHLPIESGNSLSRLLEQSSLTREIAEPICSGSSDIELKDTSKDFIAVSLQMGLREQTFGDYQAEQSGTQIQRSRNTYSPIAAGS